jgi:hypothetical protein
MPSTSKEVTVHLLLVPVKSLHSADSEKANWSIQSDGA